MHTPRDGKLAMECLTAAAVPIEPIAVVSESKLLSPRTVSRPRALAVIASGSPPDSGTLSGADSPTRAYESYSSYPARDASSVGCNERPNAAASWAVLAGGSPSVILAAEAPVSDAEVCEELGSRVAAATPAAEDDATETSSAATRSLPLFTGDTGVHAQRPLARTTALSPQPWSPRSLNCTPAAASGGDTSTDAPASVPELAARLRDSCETPPAPTPCAALVSPWSPSSLSPVSAPLRVGGCSPFGRPVSANPHAGVLSVSMPSLSAGAVGGAGAAAAAAATTLAAAAAAEGGVQSPPAGSFAGPARTSTPSGPQPPWTTQGFFRSSPVAVGTFILRAPSQDDSIDLTPTVCQSLGSGATTAILARAEPRRPWSALACAAGAPAGSSGERERRAVSSSRASDESQPWQARRLADVASWAAAGELPCEAAGGNRLRSVSSATVAALAAQNVASASQSDRRSPSDRGAKHRGPTLRSIALASAWPAVGQHVAPPTATQPADSEEVSALSISPNVSRLHVGGSTAAVTPRGADDSGGGGGSSQGSPRDRSAAISSSWDLHHAHLEADPNRRQPARSGAAPGQHGARWTVRRPLYVGGDSISGDEDDNVRTDAGLTASLGSRPPKAEGQLTHPSQDCTGSSQQPVPVALSESSSEVISARSRGGAVGDEAHTTAGLLPTQALPSAAAARAQNVDEGSEVTAAPLTEGRLKAAERTSVNASHGPAVSLMCASSSTSSLASSCSSSTLRSASRRVGEHTGAGPARAVLDSDSLPQQPQEARELFGPDFCTAGPTADRQREDAPSSSSGRVLGEASPEDMPSQGSLAWFKELSRTFGSPRDPTGSAERHRESPLSFWRDGGGAERGALSDVRRSGAGGGPAAEADDYGFRTPLAACPSTTAPKFEVMPPMSPLSVSMRNRSRLQERLRGRAGVRRRKEVTGSAALSACSSAIGSCSLLPTFSRESSHDDFPHSRARVEGMMGGSNASSSVCRTAADSADVVNGTAEPATQRVANGELRLVTTAAEQKFNALPGFPVLDTSGTPSLRQPCTSLSSTRRASQTGGSVRPGSAASSSSLLSCSAPLAWRRTHADPTSEWAAANDTPVTEAAQPKNELTGQGGADPGRPLADVRSSGSTPSFTVERVLSSGGDVLGARSSASASPAAECAVSSASTPPLRGSRPPPAVEDAFTLAEQEKEPPSRRAVLERAVVVTTASEALLRPSSTSLQGTAQAHMALGENAGPSEPAVVAETARARTGVHAEKDGSAREPNCTERQVRSPDAAGSAGKAMCVVRVHDVVPDHTPGHTSPLFPLCGSAYDQWESLSNDCPSLSLLPSSTEGFGPRLPSSPCTGNTDDPHATLRPCFAFTSLRGCRSHQEDNVIILPDITVDTLEDSTDGRQPDFLTPLVNDERGGSTTATDRGAVPVRLPAFKRQSPMNAQRRIACFGVFDGHNGDQVSCKASQYFLEHFTLAFREHYADQWPSETHSRAQPKGRASLPGMTAVASGNTAAHVARSSDEEDESSEEDTLLFPDDSTEVAPDHRALSAALVQCLLHLDVTLYDALQNARCDAGSTACVAACYLPMPRGRRSSAEKATPARQTPHRPAHSPWRPNSSTQHSSSPSAKSKGSEDAVDDSSATKRVPESPADDEALCDRLASASVTSVTSSCTRRQPLPRSPNTHLMDFGADKGSVTFSCRVTPRRAPRPSLGMNASLRGAGSVFARSTASLPPAIASLPFVAESEASTGLENSEGGTLARRSPRSLVLGTPAGAPAACAGRDPVSGSTAAPIDLITPDRETEGASLSALQALLAPLTVAGARTPGVGCSSAGHPGTPPRERLPGAPTGRSTLPLGAHAGSLRDFAPVAAPSSELSKSRTSDRRRESSVTLAPAPEHSDSDSDSGSDGEDDPSNCLKLSIANLGDSRAVVGSALRGELLLETQDHRIRTFPSERERILSCGGRVEFDRIEGCLDVTRGLGDFRFKTSPTSWWDQHPLSTLDVKGTDDPTCPSVHPNRARKTGATANAADSAEDLTAGPGRHTASASTRRRASDAPLSGNVIGNVADVYECSVQHGDFLVIASDGVWDRITSDEVVSFVTEELQQLFPSSVRPAATTTTTAATTAAAAVSMTESQPHWQPVKRQEPCASEGGATTDGVRAWTQSAGGATEENAATPVLTPSRPPAALTPVRPSVHDSGKALERQLPRVASTATPLTGVFGDHVKSPHPHAPCASAEQSTLRFPGAAGASLTGRPPLFVTPDRMSLGTVVSARAGSVVDPLALEKAPHWGTSLTGPGSAAAFLRTPGPTSAVTAGDLQSTPGAQSIRSGFVQHVTNRLAEHVLHTLNSGDNVTIVLVVFTDTSVLSGLDSSQASVGATANDNATPKRVYPSSLSAELASCTLQRTPTAR